MTEATRNSSLPLCVCVCDGAMMCRNIIYYAASNAAHSPLFWLLLLFALFFASSPPGLCFLSTCPFRLCSYKTMQKTRQKKTLFGVCKWNIYEKKYFCYMFIWMCWWWCALRCLRLACQRALSAVFCVPPNVYTLRMHLLSSCWSFFLLLFASAGSRRFYLFFVRQHLYYKIFFYDYFSFQYFSFAFVQTFLYATFVSIKFEIYFHFDVPLPFDHFEGTQNVRILCYAHYKFSFVLFLFVADKNTNNKQRTAKRRKKYRK